MSEPPWLDPEEDPTEPGPMLDWKPPPDPLASNVARAFQKKPAPSRVTPGRRVAGAIGWFVLRFLAGICLMLAVLAIWFLIIGPARWIPGKAAFPALILMIIATIITAAGVSIRFKWHGLVSGVLTTLIAIVATVVGIILLVLYQCSHTRW